MGAPLTACAIVLAGLAVVGLLDSAGDPGPPVPTQGTTPVAVIAERVERLRLLRFEEEPAPRRVSVEQTRREGLAALDRDYPADRRRADETVLATLGLVPPGTDLREATATILGSEVAGYYDPSSGRLRVVEGTGSGTPVLDELTLAHELTHALEDQAFGLRTPELSGAGDAELAYLALVEGAATAIMVDYAARHLSAGEALAGLLPSVLGDDRAAEELPPFILEQLAFPYLGGRDFVDALRRRARGRWTLVDLAHRVRGPSSTEQILHPEKWIAVEQPLRVAIGAGKRLGPDWSRAAHGTLGEWMTRQLLEPAMPAGARSAATGWGGDAYELWRRDGAGECETPCARSTALVLRWRWDTRADARQFAAGADRYLEEALDARPARAGGRRARGAGVALARAPGGVSLVFAPTPSLATRLAKAQAR